MRGTVVGVETKLVVEECITCGVLFGMPLDLWNRCQEKGGTFYCPSGHPMVFTEPEVARLKRLLDEAKGRNMQLVRQLDQVEIDRSRLHTQLDGTLDAMNRQMKRANAGLCPHCRRNFANVRRHIETKHPEKI